MSGRVPALGVPPTVRTAVADATRRLRAAGCDCPRLDAELLLAAALESDRTALHLEPGRELPAGAGAVFAALCARREAREPVAYILGRRGFRGLDLTVDARVLIPRPETELLVEVALGLPRGARVVDVGTGCGAVALALADERPDLVVTATDISAAALTVARANARRLELDVTFRRADLLAGAGGPFDAVVANLPYIAVVDGAALEPEISGYEPDGALFGGTDGLDFIRRLLAGLEAGVAFVALELGQGQAPGVAELMRAAGMTDIETHPDLAGIDRVVTGRRT